MTGAAFHQEAKPTTLGDFNLLDFASLVTSFDFRRLFAYYSRRVGSKGKNSNIGFCLNHRRCAPRARAHQEQPENQRHNRR
jgi:hypothetical protein